MPVGIKPKQEMHTMFSSQGTEFVIQRVKQLQNFKVASIVDLA